MTDIVAPTFRDQSSEDRHIFVAGGKSVSSPNNNNKL